MTENERLKIFRNSLKQTQFKFGEVAGLKQGSYADIERGKVKVSTDLKHALNKEFSLNIEWLETGTGEMTLVNRQPKLEAKPLRLADPMGFEATNDRFYTLPDDSLIMQVTVIPYKAWGSYLRGHGDSQFYDDLESLPVPVDKKHFGSYLYFEMGGESMINITNFEMARKSLWPGQKILGRDLPKDKWRYKLHINTTEAWIIVHRTEGIVVKAIIDHDVDNGLITLHSWNPDKETYPDFTVSLDDVEQIFNVVDPLNKLI